MSDKNKAIAENIIRSEGFIFALAVIAGKEGDLRKARRALKQRLIRELDLAEGRGANP